MKNGCPLVFCVLLVSTALGAAEDDAFRWPDNAKAAVCLTYDDGLDGHLDVAAPMLERYGLRGSFYATGQSRSLALRMKDWRSLVRRGHELGNHTLFHPCDRDKHDWVKPEFDLGSYSPGRIREELYVANTLLQAIDGKETRSYAYTCSDYLVADGISIVDTVRELFPAARSDGPIPQNMAEVDLHFMPSWCVDDPTGAELIRYVEEARQKGTIAIFMFHSVGGGYLNVSAEAHEELLAYLKANRDHYYVDTFLRVCQYIEAERQRG